MNCSRSSKEREVVIDYCAGTLDPCRTAEFESHLEHCDDCTAMVAAQRDVWKSLDRWGQVNALPEVSPDFDARLYARIAQEQAGSAWKQWLRSMMPATPGTVWKPAISMAALGAMLAVGLAVHAPKPSQNMQVESNRADIHVDIEQVANALDELDLLMPVSQAMPAPQSSRM
jgi:hypothetical protein